MRHQQRWRQVVIALVLTGIASTSSHAAQLKQARVSQVVRDVKLLPQQAAPRPAQINDDVRENTAVRTGTESRAELTFSDQTLARLGASTIFSFNEGTRNLELGGGAMLLRVPKNTGGAQINTAAITAAITGTTIMLEFHPNAYCKFIVLEGVGRIFRKGHVGESVLVHAGQMLIVNPNGTGLPEPVDVDLERLMKTSLLITGFPPLLSLDLIDRQIEAQNREISEGGLLNSNLVIFGGGTAVSLLDPTNVNLTDQANANETRQPGESPTPAPTETPTPTATITPNPPTPTPSKTGTPSVISSPVPYVIGSGTTIQTDPSITTNGQTDFGKFYRGPTLDGSPSVYLFGATSAFDLSFGFDEHFSEINLLPLAVFKFSSLEIAGDPSIVIPPGGATNLALVSVGDITSGTPGGALTFAGLNSLLLATQDGSITLSSDLSFENIPALAIYARGQGSNLTLNSALSGTTDLFLGAEGNIISDGDLTITQTNDGLSLGLFAIVIAGGDITIGNSLSLVNDNSGSGNLLAGATITLSAGGDLTLNGDGNLTLTVANNDGGSIGTGGNINLSTGGDLNTGAVALLIDNSNNGDIGTGGSISFVTGGDLVTNSRGAAFTIQNTTGTISDGGNLTLTVGGSLATQALALFIDNFDFSTSAAGHIGAGGNLFVTTGGDLTADSIDALINNRSGGTIDSGGNMTFNVGGALTTAGDAGFTISSRFDGTDNGSTLGSVIGSDVTLEIVAGSVDIGGSLINATFGGPDSFSGISNTGSVIDGNATYTWDISGDMTIQGDASFDILNDSDAASPLGGTLHGNATIQVNAASLSAGSLFVLVDNRNQITSGGVIDSDATISLNIAGNLSTTSDATFEILNQRAIISTGGTGGTIGSDAMINVIAASVSATGSLFTSISNHNDGNIGGSALIDFGIAGDISSQSDATFEILNNDNGSGFGGGTIASDATISVTAANVSTTGSLFSSISNDAGGNIGGNALIDFALSGDIDVQGDAFFQIFNNDSLGSGNPGIIDGDATVNVNATDITASSLLAQIDNSSGGSIGGTANVAVNVTNDVTAPGGATLQILNGNGGDLGTGAAGDGVSYSVGGTTSTTDLTLYVDSSAGGLINSGGNVTLDTVGPVMLDGALVLEVDNFNGGTINTGANVTAHFVGDVTDTVGDFHSLNWNLLNGSGFFNPTATGGTIGTGGNLDITFDGNASTTGTSTTGSISAHIENGNGGSIETGGNISMTVGGNLNAGPLFLTTENNGGHIGTGGNITLDVSGDTTTQGDAVFQISNDDNGNGSGPGTIDSDATINVTAANISAGGSLFADILNLSGGNIAGNASVSVTLTGDPGDLTTQGDALFFIANGGGTIGGNATIDVSAANLTSNSSLFAQIGNAAGTIGGSATINSTFTGTVTVSGDANVNIFNASDAVAGGAAINFNGGTYNVGGTFFNTIDEDGAITFNNAIINADVLKSGVFGANGTLTVGGGTLSGNTELKLYAPGSNGTLNFISNVTLNSESNVILAAQTVTINNGIVVNITGDDGTEALVFTNVPNYSEEFGGNDSTTGTFAGNGATTAPLDQAPPFDDSDGSAKGAIASPPTPTANSSSPGDRAGGADAARPRVKRRLPIARITDSNELLALMDKVTSGPTEAGRGGSRPATGKTLPGKGRTLAPAGNVARPDLMRSRDLAHRPAALP